MDLAGIRLLTRRRINEVVADNFADSEINTLINIAYDLILRQIRRVDPLAVVHWSYRDTVAGANWYAKPAGTRGIASVGLRTVTGGTYTTLDPKAYSIARIWTGANPVYCHRGTYIGIFPAPAAAIVQGLEIQHAPTATLALDTDETDVDTGLQYAIVLWATLLAKGESPESDSKEAAQLQQILGDIPNDFGHPSLDRSPQMGVDIASLPGRPLSSTSILR